jgi:hypothetical protein
MAAYSFLAEKRRMREWHAQLSMLSLSNSGDGKEIVKQLEKWERDCA